MIRYVKIPNVNFLRIHPDIDFHFLETLFLCTCRTSEESFILFQCMWSYIDALRWILVNIHLVTRIVLFSKMKADEITEITVFQLNY